MQSIGWIRQMEAELYIDYETITKKDFEKPDLFEKILNIAKEQGELQELQALNRLADKGKSVGVTNVKVLYKSYQRDVKRIQKRMQGGMKTQFEGQPLELNTTWNTENGDVKKDGVVACKHPIMITKKFVNVDTRTVKVFIEFKQGLFWRNVTVDKVDVSSRSNIIQLANHGISVTSENAAALIRYLQELQDINELETVYSASRLGWVKHSFMPYSADIEFDGDIEFKRLFHSVKEQGNRETWVNAMRGLRAENQIYSLVLAASLVSPMLEPLSALPGFVHLWSGISGSGKTVLAMIAASCWGDPTPGYFMQSFNSTTVAMERLASTLNSLPLVLDELQLTKDNWGNQRFDVYKLAQGLGRGRGRKSGGIEQTATWCNTIITTGESPIVSDSDGQGAHARVLEVEVKEVLVTAQEGNELVRLLSKNYGFAGKEIVNSITDLNIREFYDEALADLEKVNPDIQEKQKMLGAAVLTADRIATETIFMDDTNTNGLTAEYLADFLKTNKESSIEQRAYDYIIDWVAVNKNKFQEDSPYECYGYFEDDYVYIIRNVFNKVMQEQGFSNRSVLSMFARKGWIKTKLEASTRKVRHDVVKRGLEKPTRFVALQIVGNEQGKQGSLVQY